jgi:esterase/lipase
LSYLAQVAFGVILLFINSCTQSGFNEYRANIKNNSYYSSTPHYSMNTNEYLISEKIANEKYDRSVKENNHSKILYGEADTAVILLHGFISSPFEVYFLGEEINKRGFTVFLPLIAGFGGSTKLANESNHTSWQLTLKNSINLISQFYPKIFLIGFSLGGAIVTDFILNNDDSESKIQGAILLAPFFSPKMFAANFINSSLCIFTDSISLQTLYRLSRNEDLIIPMANPDYYNSEMPLSAVKKIIKFGRDIRSNNFHKSNELPILYVYTEDDQSVDNAISEGFVKENFLNLKIIKFEEDKKVRHQFAVPVGNREFNKLCISVINFLEGEINRNLKKN